MLGGAQLIAIMWGAATVSAFRPEPEKKAFSDIDADKDGRLDDVEVDAHLELTFEREAAAFMEFFDANGDGTVTDREYGAKAKQFFKTDERTADWFWESIDQDENGLTDPEEMHNQRSLILSATAQELARQWARKHDTNGDSYVSKAEFLKYNPKAEATFLTMDRDGDGKMTTREYLQTAGIGGKPSMWIKHQDRDNDGFVSSSEYYSTHTEL